MRILPLLFYIRDKNIEERFRIVEAISSLTHRHIRSVTGCFIYLELALQLIQGKEKFMAYEDMKTEVNRFLLRHPSCPQSEIDKYHRILGNPVGHDEVRPLYELGRDEVYSSGYVLHTLEASIWCILKTDHYKDAVLMAVNLGDDTDTTGAVTGGLAGLLYGREGIPASWLEVLARKADILSLAQRLREKWN
ncbi:ADP-ribosylglycohydrolase [Taibaiella chishuiensis]|uniref:ADP-ribosylglycohydrolase n=1 Tax=Taibaiella chishuiensis TaxID=1434707 RepID=A0A2P8DAV5_9BACT|nr:ADP-ribosylglycohydrolase [Taibaiella chishuiensis]